MADQLFLLLSKKGDLNIFDYSERSEATFHRLNCVFGRSSKAVKNRHNRHQLLYGTIAKHKRHLKRFQQLNVMFPDIWQCDGRGEVTPL